MIDETIGLLGLTATDRVTGFKGVVSTVSFDLFGCVQIVLTPAVKDGERKDAHWFDVARLEISDDDRVMPVPAFRAMATHPADFDHGPSEKPAMSALPMR